jgi:predicted phosphodiesterase
LERFNNYFNGVLGDLTKLGRSADQVFPFIKVLDNRIALIALESNQLLPHFKSNAVCSNGYVEPEETRQILSHSILQNKIKIILMHHHLLPEQAVRQQAGKWVASTIKLRNRLEITEILKTSQADLILHGHYHVHQRYHLPGSDIPVLNNGDNRNWSLIRVDNNSLDIFARNSIENV